MQKSFVIRECNIVRPNEDKMIEFLITVDNIIYGLMIGASHYLICIIIQIKYFHKVIDFIDINNYKYIFPGKVTNRISLMNVKIAYTMLTRLR